MQGRMLLTTIVGYTLFYFLRKNLSLAMPGLAQDYGITKSSLGLFLTLHGIVYGVGKFAVGPVSDKSNPRWFLMGGLFLALLANVAFGFGPVFAKLIAGGGDGGRVHDDARDGALRLHHGPRCARFGRRGRGDVEVVCLRAGDRRGAAAGLSESRHVGDRAQLLHGVSDALRDPQSFD